MCIVYLSKLVLILKIVCCSEDLRYGARSSWSPTDLQTQKIELCTAEALCLVNLIFGCCVLKTLFRGPELTHRAENGWLHWIQYNMLQNGYCQSFSHGKFATFRHYQDCLCLPMLREQQRHHICLTYYQLFIIKILVDISPRASQVPGVNL